MPDEPGDAVGIGAPAPTRGVAERWVAPVRDAIAPRDSGRAFASDSPSTAVERWVAPARDAIAPRGEGRSFSDLLPDLSGFTLPSWAVGAFSPSSPAGTAAQPQAPGAYRYYPGDDAFSVLADLFTRTFGADNPQQGTTQYGVVPTQVGGGGSGNGLLILAVLGLAGVGIWWFYFRKKGTANA